jgi:poly(3-hydroxybutyrate) depolymerase
MNRRQFLGLSAAGLLQARLSADLSAVADAKVEARSAKVDATSTSDEFKYGESRLGISDTDRDGTLYVPRSYKPGTPMPVMMMLHGFMGSGDGIRGMFPLAEEFGVIMIAPESRGMTWGRSIPGFDADVRYLGPAYRRVANLVDLDIDHVALGGVSDGAGYALSMGLAYGDAFNHVIVLAGGQMVPFRRQGKPRLFVAHGTEDVQMPIDQTARKYVPQLKTEGYDVTYREYPGGHRVPPTEIREAFKWFTGRDPRPQ